MFYITSEGRTVCVFFTGIGIRDRVKLKILQFNFPDKCVVGPNVKVVNTIETMMYPSAP